MFNIPMAYAIEIKKDGELMGENKEEKSENIKLRRKLTEECKLSEGNP